MSTHVRLVRVVLVALLSSLLLVALIAQPGLAVTFNEYTVPTANSQPFGITAGPDGNLWFTEGLGNGNKIGKVTTTGSFTEYPVPTPNSFPSGITGGPDGNLWFTEDFGNKIGKVTTTGSFTEYPVPTANSGPISIADGPDGNLWFTEGSGSKVGKVTTSGVITEYPVPTAFSEPFGITASPDGNLWFTETNGNNIGVVVLGRTTSTSVTCSPTRIRDHHSTTCTAIVKDTSSGTPITPTGTVSWTSTGRGFFGTSGTCTLTATSKPGTATCRIVYAGTPGKPVQETITGTYSGDSRHSGSQGSTTVIVS